MSEHNAIPVFALFGETDHFPDVVHCEEISARAPIHDWHISAHRHTQMAQLFLLQDGHASAQVDGRAMTLNAGAFLYVPVQKVHMFDFEPGTRGRVVSFPLATLNSVGPAAQDLRMALASVLSGPASDALLRLVDMLAEVTSGTATFRAQLASGLAHSVLSIIAEAAHIPGAAQPAARNPRMAAFDALIMANLQTGWSASQFASALAMSTGHLSRICRSETGMGAAAYLEMSLMEEACRLLAFTELPVSEVGYRLGYADPSYFSKRFRHVRALSPSDYRAQFTA